MGEFDAISGTDGYYKCGRPAKYITPSDKRTGKKLFVCGYHKVSVDKFQKRIDSAERCIPIGKTGEANR
jgi:hypothetical protein